MTNSEYIPNSFQTPNEIVDNIQWLLTLPEFAVLIFMVRHILGWKHKIRTRRARIGIRMIRDGYGSFRGTGLGFTAILKALEGLEQYRIICKVGSRLEEEAQEWELLLTPDIIGLGDRLIAKKKSESERTEVARQAAEASRQMALLQEASDDGDPFCPTEHPLFCPTEQIKSIILLNPHFNNTLKPNFNLSQFALAQIGDEVSASPSGKVQELSIQDELVQDTLNAKEETAIQRGIREIAEREVQLTARRVAGRQKTIEDEKVQTVDAYMKSDIMTILDGVKKKWFLDEAKITDKQLELLCKNPAMVYVDKQVKQFPSPNEMITNYPDYAEWVETHLHEMAIWMYGKSGKPPKVALLVEAARNYTKYLEWQAQPKDAAGKPVVQGKFEKPVHPDQAMADAMPGGAYYID